MRWKVSDFGRACLAGARPGTGGCLATAGALAAAPEAGRVALTPASDVWGAGLVFLLLRCAHGPDTARRGGAPGRGGAVPAPRRADARGRVAGGDAGPALGKTADRVVARGRIRGPGAAAVC